MILLLLACSPEPAPVADSPWPVGFRFGAAVAGFQVDPGCPSSDCTDPNSDWYQWVTEPSLQAEGGLYISGEALTNGPGHWELWEEDLDRARDELHLSAHRFSLEWSRLFPDGAAEGATSVADLYDHVDQSALAWYQAYLDGMVDRGLEPVVTLNHYTLPLWVHEGLDCHLDPDGCAASGWQDGERMAGLIGLYAGFCAEVFGDRVTWWATQNEPFAIVIPGYALQDQSRSNPPGLQDVDLAMEVFKNLAHAHGVMADAVHDADPDAMVGVVANIPVPVPSDPERELDHQGAAHMDYFYNQMFLDAFLEGRIDDDLDGEWDRVDDAIPGRTDFVGVNHYNVVPVIGFEDPIPVLGGYPVLDFLPSTAALEDTGSLELNAALDRVEPYGLPMWITENGYKNPDDDTVDEWMAPNLELLRERAEVSDLRGYLYWSLVDNYEWNLGMAWRFGLYRVDSDTKERQLRAVGEYYAEIAAQALD